MSGKRIKGIRKAMRKERDVYFVVMFNALCAQPLRERLANAARILLKRGI